MTTSSSAEKPEGAGLIAWVAHRELKLYFTGMGLTVLGVALGPSLITVIAIFIGLLLLGAASLGYGHFRKLCVKCMEGMPVNGAELAARKRRTLKFRHIKQRTLMIYSAVALTLSFVPPIFFTKHVAVWTFSVLVYTVTLGWGVYSGHWHRRLLPWCPDCRRGGGGGPREQVPDPLPSMTVDR